MESTMNHCQHQWPDERNKSMKRRFLLFKIQNTLNQHLISWKSSENTREIWSSSHTWQYFTNTSDNLRISTGFNKCTNSGMWQNTQFVVSENTFLPSTCFAKYNAHPTAGPSPWIFSSYGPCISSSMWGKTWIFWRTRPFCKIIMINYAFSSHFIHYSRDTDQPTNAIFISKISNSLRDQVPMIVAQIRMKIYKISGRIASGSNLLRNFTWSRLVCQEHNLHIAPNFAQMQERFDKIGTLKNICDTFNTGIENKVKFTFKENYKLQIVISILRRWMI